MKLLSGEEGMVELHLCWKLQSSSGRAPFSLAISFLIMPLAMLTVCCIELAWCPPPLPHSSLPAFSKACGCVNMIMPQ